MVHRTDFFPGGPVGLLIGYVILGTCAVPSTVRLLTYAQEWIGMDATLPLATRLELMPPKAGAL